MISTPPSRCDMPLLPCPFCGSEAKRKRILKIDHALCTRCGCCTGIMLWNKRAAPIASETRPIGEGPIHRVTYALSDIERWKKDAARYHFLRSPDVPYSLLTRLNHHDMTGEAFDKEVDNVMKAHGHVSR